MSSEQSRNNSVREITSDIKLIKALDAETSLQLSLENIQDVERWHREIFPNKWVEVTSKFLLSNLQQYLGKYDKE